MPNVQSALRLLALVLIFIANNAVARDTDTSPVPSLPKRDQVSLIGLQPTLFGADGSVTWIAADYNRKTKVADGRCGVYPAVKRSWQPADGTTQETPLGVGADGLGAQLATPAGILFVTVNPGFNCVVLVQPNNAVVTAKLTQRFVEPRLALLPDGSVAVVERDAATRHIRVDIVRLRGNQLSSEQMPALATPYRNDFQQAPLPDGRLMVLGGSDAQYRGCSPCRAETKTLDPKTKTWTAGPSMLEARSEHLATSLPDGSVLVTGGWTPTQGWGHGPSRTAERWNPATNKFEAVAPMPSGSARHRAVWMPGQQGKTLLIAGGNNSSVHAYDLRTGTWRTAGASWQGNEEGGDTLVPFVFGGNLYAWTTQARGDWQLAALRSPKVSASPTPEKFLVTYRSSAAIVPATGNKPALVIGGSIHAGMNSYLVTSAVEAVDLNGDVRSLPSLREARRGASAYRFGNGVLAIGGEGEDSNNARTAKRSLPMEWLASDAPESGAQWITLTGPGIGDASTTGASADTSQLVIDASGGIRRIALKPGSGELPSIKVDHAAYPTLNRARQGNDGAELKIHALPDGRVVVAGGQVQAEKIALLGEGSDKPDAADEYIGIGEYLPSRRHEIYEPASKRWRTSAPSRGAGGKVAILPDGRVLKIGQLPGKNENEQTYVLEISNAEGTAWSTLPAESRPKIKLQDSAKPFVVDGELFLSGELGDLSTGGGPSGVEWFNSATGKWEILWHAWHDDNWRDHNGRLIVRQLANGKKVILPVNGY